MYEAASTTKIVLVSLSGEKLFAGSTYKVIDNGVVATGSGNRIQYAASLALTNDHLYFLIGSQSAPNGTSTSITYMYYQAWSGHFIMRYKIARRRVERANCSTAPPATRRGRRLLRHEHADRLPAATARTPSRTSTGPGICAARARRTATAPRPLLGVRRHEHEGAQPGPGAVPRQPRRLDGGVLRRPGRLDYYGTDVYSNYCWVDTGDGARRVTSTRRRHLNGSARGYTIFDGPENTGGGAWGRYQPVRRPASRSPTTARRWRSSTTRALNYFYGSDTYSIAEPKNYRDNIILTSTTNGWGSVHRAGRHPEHVLRRVHNTARARQLHQVALRGVGLHRGWDGAGLLGRGRQLLPELRRATATSSPTCTRARTSSTT